MVGIALALLIGVAPPSGPRFVNVAAEAGVNVVVNGGGAAKDHLLESVGCGVAWIDFDDDGWQDLYVVNGWALDEEPSGVRTRGRNVLYRNLGNGRFEDVTARAGVGDDGWGCGVCAGDYDGDGHVDLYVTNFGPNRLYRNLGDGTFQETADVAGVADPGWGGGAAFLDADGDGDLDLYLANYVDCTMEDVLTARRTTRWRNMASVMAGPFGLRGGRDRYYRNRGDGTFADATDEAGLTDTAERYGLGVIAADLDGDGDLDLYVANDSNPNYLYRNDGSGHFQETGLWSGAALDSAGNGQGGMGLAAGDTDGDGDPELLVMNFGRDVSTLYENLGDALFADVTVSAGLAEPTFMPLSWGAALSDFDLDGDLDIFIANGHIYPQADEVPETAVGYAQANLLLANEGGRFSDVGARSGPGLAVLASSRGVAVGDIDNDGDLDLAVANVDAPPSLLRNDSKRRGAWLLVDAPGALRVVAEAGGRRFVREGLIGASFLSAGDPRFHFGLGPVDTVERLRVVWLDGEETLRTDVAVNQLVVVRR